MRSDPRGDDVPVGLAASAHQQAGSRSRVAHERDGVDRPEPALVGIEPGHLHERRAVAERFAQRARFGRGERFQPSLGDPVRQHGGVDACGRHLGAHEARDRRDRCRAAEDVEIDAAEPVGVVRVPQDGRGARRADAKQHGGRDGGIGRLPVLEEHHGAPALGRRRGHDIREVRRNRAREVAPLAVLTVVHVARVVGADPLRPALENETPIGALFARRELRITDEDLMHEVPAVDQRVGEVDHPRGEAADERIAVGPFERDEHHVVHRRARIMARAS